MFYLPRLTHASFVLSLLFACTIMFSSCQKLDDDGGYYDEKKGLYKYVFPDRTIANSSAFLKIKSLQPGVEQQIQGVVNSIDGNLKSIWLKIESRQIYMILAERLSRGNRNDKDKLIRIDLSYVSPALISSKSQNFKKQWRDYLKKLFKAELVGKNVLADVRYQERSKKVWGVVYKIIKTKKTSVIRNVNKWMIINGLSYYIIERGLPDKNTDYLNAQNIAIKNKSGLWKY